LHVTYIHNHLLTCISRTDLLKDEFLSVPIRHIANVLKQHKTLFKAYIVLEEQVRNYRRISNKLFATIGKARIKKGVELTLIERGSQVPKELHAAKKKIENETAKRRKAEQTEQAEAMNLQYAQSNDQMGECACCFDDVPLNRMISCNGTITHSYCLQCPKRQIETQMGLSNCRPKCFGVDNCEGTFIRKDLQKVLSDQTFDRLEHMQQLEDLAAAGLDFLSECPFCDFKMECPPVEVDKEFRCQNKKCGKTSCRLCEKETHIPLTCKEADKDGQITLRHIVEEAMSAALIRQCNRCRHPFVKEYGCNKMTCSHCRNVQWSVDPCVIPRRNANSLPVTCALRTLPITSILVRLRRAAVPCTKTLRTATSKKSRRQLMKPWRKSERTTPACLMPI
jgi:TRIAD3 protein (E3 ubiquitin-protein ligase RNF216)